MSLCYHSLAHGSYIWHSLGTDCKSSDAKVPEVKLAMPSVPKHTSTSCCHWSYWGGQFLTTACCSGWTSHFHQTAVSSGLRGPLPSAAFLAKALLVVTLRADGWQDCFDHVQSTLYKTCGMPCEQYRELVHQEQGQSVPLSLKQQPVLFTCRPRQCHRRTTEEHQHAFAQDLLNVEPGTEDSCGSLYTLCVDVH